MSYIHTEEGQIALETLSVLKDIRADLQTLVRVATTPAVLKVPAPAPTGPFPNTIWCSTAPETIRLMDGTEVKP